jgi:two-component system chemotaxis response regulator CheY
MASILVVDDSPVIRRVLDFTLRRAGHTTVAAEDGFVALDCLAHTGVDLAIIDLDMPVMDGLTLLRRLRADERHPDLPVIMLTGSGQGQDRHSAEAQGADAFLTKPASSVELIEVVNRLLACKDARAQD